MQRGHFFACFPWMFSEPLSSDEPGFESDARGIATELLAPAPRFVRRRAAKKIGWIALIFVPHLLVGLFLLCWTAHYSLTLWTGVTVPARVLRFSSSTSSKGGTTHRVHYRYNWQNRPIESSSQVGNSEFYSLPSGSIIQVKVLAQTPETGSIALMPGGSPGTYLLVLWAMSLVWNGFAWGVGGAIVLGIWKEKRLIRYGTATRGRITSVKETSTKINRQAVWKVNYEFSPDGATRKQVGRANVSPQEAQTLRESQKITVIYDPSNPCQNVAYDFAAFEVAPRKSGLG